jgi:nucleotide-binding universal stress UspA family protein
MRWIAGLDFEDRCTGVVQMASWLRDQAALERPQDLVAVHVLPENIRRMLVVEATAGAPELVAENMHRLVADARIQDPFSDYQVPWAKSVEDGLADVARRLEVDGILIGKATGYPAPIFGGLGRVARRLLRRLPAPVMVVPPDFTATQVGKGPIVLATDLEASAVPAAAAADDLARSLRREIVVVGVEEVFRRVPVLTPEAFIPLSLIERITLARLRAWTSARGLEAARSVVREGERVQMILEVARKEDAAVIVCGSRCLHLGQRIFASSTASELARRAERPVLVVPGHPPDGDVRT